MIAPGFGRFELVGATSYNDSVMRNWFASKRSSRWPLGTLDQVLVDASVRHCIITMQCRVPGVAAQTTRELAARRDRVEANATLQFWPPPTTGTAPGCGCRCTPPRGRCRCPGRTGRALCWQTKSVKGPSDRVWLATSTRVVAAAALTA